MTILLLTLLLLLALTGCMTELPQARPIPCPGLLLQRRPSKGSHTAAAAAVRYSAAAAVADTAAGADHPAAADHAVAPAAAAAD